MTGWYATAIIVISLLLVLWAGILLVIKRQPDLILALGGVLLEVLLLGFVIGGIVQMVGSDRDFARAEFVGYLFACLVVLPAAFLWARGEKSRAGLAVIAVAYLLLPILIMRVQQVWEGNNVQ
ncbi:MAG: hypothetical protein F2889_04730 [Actinobacteria bacterium]|uniref:Unannotated protein n=1 Tax=freshwater metagenome TaxID=449393 RepID=A0A6J7PXQ7_9ZZZZ|nr:hypothetical protein [Actinomycetota bacterium]